MATAYLKSLLHLQILPHRELQLFVFDLCAFLGDFALLQQLLHYHVVLDSADLARRLTRLCQLTGAGTGSGLGTGGASAWLSQCALDMAFRFRDFPLAVEVLLLRGQFADAIFLCRSANLLRYPL